MNLPSARGVELKVQYDDDKWSHLELTKNHSGLQRHLLILLVEALPIRLEVLHWDLHSIRSIPALEWVLGIRSLFQTILLHHLQMGKWILLPFVWSVLLSHELVAEKILCFQLFWISNQIISFPNSRPRSMHIQEIFQVKLSYRIDDACFDLLSKSDDIRPLLQMEWPVLWMALRIVFHREFPVRQEVHGRSADSNSIPWNEPTTCHPILTVAVQLRFLLSLFVLLFQQCHSSRINEVWTFCDSKISLHRI